MLLSKENLAVLQAAAKTKESNYQLGHVKIDPEKQEIAATNGHALYFSKLADIPDGEYPNVGPASAVPSLDPVMIPAKAIEKAGKNMPKNGTLAILRNIQVLTDENNHYLVTTDLETTDIVQVKHADGEYPDVEAIRAMDNGAPVAEFCLSVENIELLARVAKKAGIEYLKIDVTSGNNPIKATADGLEAYIMPSKY